MTLSREEYIARAADAILVEMGWYRAPHPEELEQATRSAKAALDAVGAYETYEACHTAASYSDPGDWAWIEDVERAISKAEGTEDQRG